MFNMYKLPETVSVSKLVPCLNREGGLYYEKFTITNNNQVLKIEVILTKEGHFLEEHIYKNTLF